MSQVQVVTAAANIVWPTDKAEIVTTANVTYNIYQISVTPPYLIAGNTTSGSNVIVTTGAQSIMVGATISGNNIPAATTVTAATAQVNLTMSANATGTASNQQLTVTLPNPGNIYANAVQVAANDSQQIYVGAGNYLTITGAGFTARALGTASSAQAGVIGV